MPARRRTTSTRRSWRNRRTARCVSTSGCRASGRRCSLTFDALFVPAPLREAVSDGAWVAAMLRTERALARVQAELGVIPSLGDDVFSVDGLNAEELAR